MTMKNKTDIRNEAKKAALSLENGYINRAGKKIQKRIISSEIYKKSKSVFIYVSLDNEAPTGEIINDAFAGGKTVLVPKCFENGIMKAVKIESTDDLEKGKFGIFEPKSYCSEYFPRNIDLAIVPCVSAFVNGARIGHGRGYYDRFFEKYQMTKICLCFERLLRDDIIMLDNDIYMDCVVTENGCYPNLLDGFGKL